MQTLSPRYRRALVTGASTGLGRAFTEMLLSEGLEVWGTARALERLPRLEGFHGLELDLADADSLKRFLGLFEHGGALVEIDIVVNNAGSGAFFPFAEFPEAQLGAQIDVLLTAPIRIARAAVPQLLERRGGVLVNVSSLAADYPLPCQPAYNAAKAGLANFSRTLMLEYADEPLTIIDFQPGDYNTGFNDATPRPPDSQMPAHIARAWRALDSHLRAAPKPQKAAQDLKKALLRNRSGTVTSGDFFQAGLGKIGAHLMPQRLLLWFLRRYYNL